MKIKRKVQMNLPQLIEWGFEQKELPPLFYGSREGSLVQFTPGGWVNITGIETTDTFTIEVEEEVNGETILDRLYEVYFDGLKHDTNMFTNTTTNSLITSKTALIYTVIDNQVIVLWEKYTGGFR